MEIKTALRLASSVCLLALAACGGGGGGGGSVATNVTPAPVTPAPTTPDPAPVTPTPVTPAPTPVVVSIGPPGQVGVSSTNTTLNWRTSPPAANTGYSIGRLNITTTPTSVAAGGITDASIIYKGTTTSGGTTYRVFDLSIPSLGVLANNLRSDGTTVTLANGATVGFVNTTLSYTLMGAWTYLPSSGTGGYLGQGVNGAATPLANLPTVGTATFTGNSLTTNGGVLGAYSVPTGTGSIQGGAVTGNVSLNANLAANTFTGSFTNMTTITSGQPSTPWNDVSLSGSITRSTVATFGGTSAASSAPSGAGIAGFSNAARGSVVGGFFGPNYEEVGGTWSLHESTPDGGKAAFGTFMATR